MPPTLISPNIWVIKKWTIGQYKRDISASREAQSGAQSMVSLVLVKGAKQYISVFHQMLPTSRADA